MKKKKFVKLLIQMIVGLTIVSLSATANDAMAASVTAILPKNQHDKSVTYFDLRMKPNQKQELTVELRNPSDKDETVKIELNNGTTNDGGTIDYSNRGQDYERDSTLKIALTDIATAPEEVVVKAQSTKMIQIKLAMPKQEFDGEIIGAIRILEADAGEKNKGTSDKGMQVKNKVAYTIGIRLTENDKKNSGELNLLKAFAGQTSGRNVVKATIQNSQPKFLEELSYNGFVTAKGKEPVLHQSKAVDYRFAPNSTFNFDISWENQPFKAGDYILHLKAQGKETGQKWEWIEEFNISALEAKRLNKTALGLEEERSSLRILIAVGVVMVMGVASLIIYIKVKPTIRRNGKTKR